MKKIFITAFLSLMGAYLVFLSSCQYEVEKLVMGPTVTNVQTNTQTVTNLSGNDDEENPMITNHLFTLGENVPTNTQVGILHAMDNASIASFTIVNNIDNAFEIEVFSITNVSSNNETNISISNEALLRTLSNLDYETKTNHVLTIAVADTGANVDVATVTVIVTNIDDETPVITNHSFSVLENVISNTSVGVVTATDDVGIVSYTITDGNSNGSFKIGASGVLRTSTTNLDYETTSNYSLTVRVADDSGKPNEATIFISIGNRVDEENPSISNQSFSTIENAETGTFIGRVLSSDNVGVVSYELSGNDTTFFSIDSAGVLRNQATIDYETSSNYQITVTVFDASSNNDSATITVNAVNQFEVKNTFNLKDNSQWYLNNVASILVTNIGESNYLFTGDDAGGVSVFLVTSDGRLEHLQSLGLTNANKTAWARVGSTNYLFVTSSSLDSVNVFSVANNGHLVGIYEVTDTNNLELNGADHIEVVEIGSNHYLYVAGRADLGISVFFISNDGGLSNVTNVPDDNTLLLNTTHSMATFEVNGTNYLCVGDSISHGIGIFLINSNGGLDFVRNYLDSSYSENSIALEVPIDIDSFKVKETNYLLITSFAENRFMEIGVRADATLNTGFHGLSPNNLLEIHQGTVARISGSYYAFVLTQPIAILSTPSSLNVFSIFPGENKSPVNKYTVYDSDLIHISDSSRSSPHDNITTHVIDGKTYLFVAGALDDGVSVFEVSE